MTARAPAVAWLVYIVRCKDGSLYTGITNDLDRRLAAHNAGRGARYTRGRRPVRLVLSETHASKGDALRREAAVKRLSTDAKKKLVAAAPKPRRGGSTGYARRGGISPP